MTQKRKKVWQQILIGAFFLLLISVAVFLIVIAVFINGLPTPEQISNRQVNQSTKIFDRTGQVLLYEIHGEEKRTIIPFAEIPSNV